VTRGRILISSNSDLNHARRDSHTLALARTDRDGLATTGQAALSGRQSTRTLFASKEDRSWLDAEPPNRAPGKWRS
jgi:hypothetical protein